MAYFFTASQDAQAITTAVDILFCTVAADKPVTLWGLDISNTTDLGDANEEVLKFGIYTGVSGGGSGSALTEVCTWDVPGTTAGAAWVGQATASTGGTLRKTIYWNVRQAGPAWVAVHELATVRCNAANDPIRRHHLHEGGLGDCRFHRLGRRRLYRHGSRLGNRQQPHRVGRTSRVLSAS